MNKTYMPKKDPLIFWVIMLTLFTPVAVYFAGRSEIHENLWILIPLLVTPVPLLWIYFQTHYILDGGTFHYRSGPISGSLEIDTIKSIRHMNSYMYASFKKAAMSKDGIIIRYHKYDEVFIAPENKDEFIQDMLTINPNIEIKK